VRAGQGHRRFSIIRTEVPMTRASSKTVTPAASAFEAKVERRS
jgi:hypothetical protein